MPTMGSISAECTCGPAHSIGADYELGCPVHDEHTAANRRREKLVDSGRVVCPFCGKHVICNACGLLLPLPVFYEKTSSTDTPPRSTGGAADTQKAEPSAGSVSALSAAGKHPAHMEDSNMRAAGESPEPESDLGRPTDSNANTTTRRASVTGPFARPVTDASIEDVERRSAEAWDPKAAAMGLARALVGEPEPRSDGAQPEDISDDLRAKAWLELNDRDRACEYGDHYLIEVSGGRRSLATQFAEVRRLEMDRARESAQNPLFEPTNVLTTLESLREEIAVRNAELVALRKVAEAARAFRRAWNVGPGTMSMSALFRALDELGDPR